MEYQLFNRRQFVKKLESNEVIKFYKNISNEDLFTLYNDLNKNGYANLKLNNNDKVSISLSENKPKNTELSYLSGIYSHRVDSEGDVFT